ncbi:hypothetical protein H4R20_005549 [Coemansia guatemalensis]|uniref:OCRE domain-containing protein n=1 Tax=Coemansia guatemalensis TaxID=2761395 RepID=A0A9W8HVF9_9FUNG|nr:hypothetical protein H4R20_005549 [Coemansia guatemalensis]
MSLSLVPEYGSSSSQSDSESEDKASTPVQQQSVAGADRTVAETAHSHQGLGTMLSNILPKPKNTAPPSEGATAENRNKIKIMVDLPPPSRIEKPVAPVSNTAPADTHSETAARGNSRSSTTGSLFSELSSILPAPKNKTKPSGAQKVTAGDAVMPHGHMVAERPLIPHSISSKRRLKAKLAAQSTAANPETGDSDRDEDGRDTGEDAQAEATTTTAEGPASFFTFDDDTRSDNVQSNLPTDDADIDGSAAMIPQQPELIYDPSSGYYYESSSGLYYYYDQANGRYIDARELYPTGDQAEHGQAFEASKGDNLSMTSAIDEAELEGIIGRRELRRGEARVALSSGGVRTVTQSMQLSDSGYSDAKAAAEFSAKRAMEKQRQKTRRAIDSDAVSKQKKSKHNIMYLALQAQEQEDALKDVHANRKRAKKEARSKYGKCLDYHFDIGEVEKTARLDVLWPIAS